MPDSNTITTDPTVNVALHDTLKQYRDTLEREREWNASHDTPKPEDLTRATMSAWSDGLLAGHTFARTIANDPVLDKACHWLQRHMAMMVYVVGGMSEADAQAFIEKQVGRSLNDLTDLDD